MSKIFKSILAVALCTCTAFAQVKPVEIGSAPVAPGTPVVQQDATPSDFDYIPVMINAQGGVASNPIGNLVYENINSAFVAGGSATTALRRGDGRDWVAYDVTLGGTDRELRFYEFLSCGNGPAWTAYTELWTDTGNVCVWGDNLGLACAAPADCGGAGTCTAGLCTTGPASLIGQVCTNAADCSGSCGSAPLTPLLGSAGATPGATNGDLGVSGFLACDFNDVKAPAGIIMPNKVWFLASSSFIRQETDPDGTGTCAGGSNPGAACPAGFNCGGFCSISGTACNPALGPACTAAQGVCQNIGVCSAPLAAHGSFMRNDGASTVGTSSNSFRRSPAGGGPPPAGPSTWYGRPSLHGPFATGAAAGGGPNLLILASGDGENCATCSFIGDGTFSGSTIGGVGPDDPSPASDQGPCGFGTSFCDSPIGDYYCYEAPCDGAATIEVTSAPQAGNDSVVYVTDDCVPTNVVACDDDSGPGFLSIATFPTVAGSTYRIRVSGWGNAANSIDCFGGPGAPDVTTDYTFTVTCTPFDCGNGIVEGSEECDDGDDTNVLDGCHNCTTQAVPNEFCEGAIEIVKTTNPLGIGTGSIIADSTGITNPANPSGSCWTGAEAGALWYKFTAAHTSARVFTCDTPDNGLGTGDDSEIAIYDGTCGSLVEIGCGEDDCGGTAACGNCHSEDCVTGLVPGNTYYVQIANWDPSDRGPYTLEVEQPCPQFQLGACCDITLNCTENVFASDCAGIFAGLDSTCGNIIACCFAGTCAEVAEGCCAASGGTPSGVACGTDNDLPFPDGLNSACGDNCPLVFNPAQTDTDSDGLGDECDNCPAVANAGQENADGDSAGDACDGCPDDPAKLAPGACGCGVPDTNTDGDSQPDCIDNCDNDPNKLEPGLCGCGVADTNTDGDSQPDCIDNCDNDPNKLEPGLCGCGVADTNSDGDSQPDCNETCDNDPNKLAPGICGCGTPDTDSDLDGFANCIEACPNDPNKQVPGICGCGVSDADTDGDTVADCNDVCPGGDDLVDANGNGTPDDCDSAGTIPTVSEWGIVIMALLLLAAGKIYFGTRRDVYMGA